MKNPSGTKVMKAGGKDYRLHLGMSVLADLQEKFGDTFDEVLSPPKDGRMPNLRVIHDVFTAALQRHHAGEADRWLVDDIIAENKDALAVLLTAAFPDTDPEDAGEVADAGKDGGGIDFAALCEGYVAAGLPPERFWDITPRLYRIEMNGALARLRRERSLVWQGAFLPHQKTPPSHDAFVGGAARKAEPASFLDMRLRASVKGLRGISMADAVASMRKTNG